MHSHRHTQTNTHTAYGKLFLRIFSKLIAVIENVMEIVDNVLRKENVRWIAELVMLNTK